MYFYLAMVGFEPTPTSTAAPSNTETTAIPSRPLRSLIKELSWPRCMRDFSALYVGWCDTSKKNITPPYPTKIVHLKFCLREFDYGL